MTEAKQPGRIWIVDSDVKPKHGGYPGYFQVVRVEGSQSTPVLDELASDINGSASAYDGEEYPKDEFKKRRISKGPGHICAQAARNRRRFL